MGQLFLFILLVFAAWAGLIFLQYRNTRREAADVYEAQTSRGEISKTTDYSIYEAVYLQTSSVRLSVYRWLAAFSAVFAFAVSVSLGAFLWARTYYLNGNPSWMTEGELVHSFSLALIGMGTLVLVAWLFVRRYHSRKPADFDLEFERAQAASQSDVNNGSTHPA